jgi:hypothetical protein
VNGELPVSIARCLYIYGRKNTKKRGELPRRSSKIVRFMAGNRNIRDPSVNHHFEENKNPKGKRFFFFQSFNGERSSCGGSTSPTHINTCNQTGYRPTRNRHFDLINTPIEEIHTAVKSACGYTHTHTYTHQTGPHISFALLSRGQFECME